VIAEAGVRAEFVYLLDARRPAQRRDRGRFRVARLWRHRRGMLTVRDLLRRREEACECYQAVSDLG
jgi:hypothetical protein